MGTLLGLCKMNWFSKKQTTSTTTNSQALRRNHVDVLKKMVPGIKEVQASTMFDAPCDTAGRLFNIRITLAPSFPSTPPTITIMPSVLHPWVNAYDQVVGHPKLAPSAWTTYTSLANVVLEVIQQLQAVPPTLKSASSSSSSSSHSTTSTSTSS